MGGQASRRVSRKEGKNLQRSREESGHIPSSKKGTDEKISGRKNGPLKEGNDWQRGIIKE